MTGSTTNALCGPGRVACPLWASCIIRKGLSSSCGEGAVRDGGAGEVGPEPESSVTVGKQLSLFVSRLRLPYTGDSGSTQLARRDEPGTR